MPSRILSAIIPLALLCAVSCHSESGSDNAGNAILTLARNGKSDYTIIYGVNQSQAGSTALAAALKDLTGTKIPVYAENAKSVKKEIVVGQTERAETRSVLSKLGGYGYAIVPEGDKFVITGTDALWTSLALKVFENKVLNNPLYLKDKVLKLPKDFSIVESFEDPQLIARYIDAGIEFTLSPSFVMDCPGDEGMKVAQGAASDGKNFYFLNRSAADGESVVYKYDMSTLEMVAQSPVFNAGHANDATFDHAHNRFIAAHGHDEGNILTPLDPVTLEPGANFEIPVGSGAITYCAARKEYAISQGARTLHITDSEFNLISSYTRNDTETDAGGYTAQGMGSDDRYVYFPMSGKTDNILVVYDWSGNYHGVLHIPLAIESESMFYSAGNYYVNFNTSKGASLYTIQPSYIYNYAK